MSAPHSQTKQALQLSEEFWNAAAERYEQVFTGTSVGRMWREAVWRELDASFRAGSRVLEINCGTGIDAIHLAQRAVSVVACDISPRMIEIARKKARSVDRSGLLDFRVLATEDLPALEEKRSFEGAFSNFSGLNCVRDLAGVSRNLARLLKPSSPVLLCLMGRFSVTGKLWRMARGHRKSAQASSRQASVDGGVVVYHRSRRQMASLFAPHFRLRRWKAIGLAVPPSFMEDWAVAFPRFTRGLNRVDHLVGGLPLFRSLGSCTLYEFERSAERWRGND